MLCPVDNAANNIAFICKKYNIQVLLKELGLLHTTSNTYQQVILFILFTMFFNNKIILLILFLD